jgi:hypothetical protein
MLSIVRDKVNRLAPEARDQNSYLWKVNEMNGTSA